ncbi:MAG: hypothetical protein QOF81_1143 [Acidimicrobiaceae bacterium]|nr:hypothetical protein [Acidimicrobiaceae bacterium]MDQ1415530.1 hypothetical protein [Acidimicrobiaceae bacterium]
MCLGLIELRAAMEHYATGFDADRLSCDDAQTVVGEASAMEHMAATVKALAAARAAEATQWKAHGHRSAEEELARRTGTSLQGAREALALGRRLAEQPEVADAARRGQLSTGQAAAISEAVDADPKAAEDLIEAAQAGGSLAELKNQCAEVKAAATDLEARRQAIHRRRHLRGWTDANGEWHLVGSGNPENGAQIMAALGPLVERAFRDARASGRREHPNAYRFDALVELAMAATGTSSASPDLPGEPDAPAPACSPDLFGGTEPDVSGCAPAAPQDRPPPAQPHNGHPAPPDRHRPDPGPADAANGAPKGGRRGRGGRARVQRGAPVKLLVRVDLDAFLRGFPTDGETCELVGYGPISVSAVQDLLKDGDPFIAAILTKGKQLLGVAHLGRQPTAHQRSALQWLYPSCAAQGCPEPADHLQFDHRHDWSQTHITLFDWLDSLCRHDHAKKTRYGWSLVDGVGKRPFVPPTDPRHPRYKPARDGPP